MTSCKKRCAEQVGMRLRILNLAGSLFTSAREPELYITLTKMEGKEESIGKHNPESFKVFRSLERFTYVNGPLGGYTSVPQ